jgi:twinkle protein
MIKEYYDASEVKQSCSNNLKTIIADIYPNAKFKGAEARIGGIEGEKGNSMSVSLDPTKFGAYYDHASGEKGDLISLVEHVKNTNYGGAIEWLGASYTSCTKRKYEPRKKRNTQSVAPSDYTVLSDECITYAKETRQISEETLKNYKVASNTDDPNIICFLDFDCNDDLSKIEYSDTREKKIWSSKDCGHNLFGKNVVTPDATSGTLIITEGRWDALSFAEASLPAVSIPSGAKNLQWIDEDWEYIQQFHTIYLAFDMDDEGENATKEVVKRLGIHKCKVIKLPLKDASDVIRTEKGKATIQRAFESAATPESGELISATSLYDATYELLLNGFENTGDEYFVPNYNLRIRPHEMTLIFGLTGQGKSQFISNQIAFDASRQIQTTIASFEQMSTMTLGSMLKQFSADKNIAHDKDKYQKAFNNLAPFITIYNSVDRTDPEKLIETFTYAHKRKGINRFVVDNVMSLDSDRDNNAEQAKIAHLFRKFTKDYPIHLFVIAHPRKPSAKEEAATAPPSVADIRGASEWGDIPENIITVWRNAKKHETMAEMIKDGRDSIEISNYDSSIPDGKIYCRKQRATGEYPMENLWFHKDSQRFTIKPMPPTPFIEL